MFEVPLTCPAGTNYKWEATKIGTRYPTGKGFRKVEDAEGPGKEEKWVYTFKAERVGQTVLESGFMPGRAPRWRPR